MRCPDRPKPQRRGMLAALSCPAAGTCMAVGYATAHNGKETPLAKAYSG